MVYFHTNQTNIANAGNNINLWIMAKLVSKSLSFIIFDKPSNHSKLRYGQINLISYDDHS